MVLVQRFFGVARLPSSSVLPGNDKLLSGFILSRQVMDCTDATLRDYKSRLRQFLRFLYAYKEGMSLIQVERQHIESYLVTFREEGRSSYTLKTQYRCLKAFYTWLVTEQFIKESPLKNIKPPRVPKRSKPFITEEQFQALLSFCPISTYLGARNAATLWLLWTTGMRLSELTNLKVSDLDTERNRIKIFGKGRKERYVPYSKEAIIAIWRYMKFRNDSLPQLWLSEERKPIKAEGIRIAITRLNQRAGIKSKDVIHIFRRSWAWRNLKAGVPVRYIQLVGGWESLSTMEIYVRAMQVEEALDIKWH